MARRDRDAKKVEQSLEILARQIQICKNEYEMYFLGIHKVPPKGHHRELKIMLRELVELGIQNTAQRFKLRVLKSRYNTHNMLWLRTCKQIEEGTYRKHRLMADIRDKRTIQEKVEASMALKAEIKAMSRGEIPQADDTPTERIEPGAPEARPSMKKPARPARRGSGHALGSSDLVAEYDRVRHELGMKGKVNSAALEAKLRKHAEIVKQRTGARDVRFRVVNEDGRPKLKAIPVK